MRVWFRYFVSAEQGTCVKFVRYEGVPLVVLFFFYVMLYLELTTLLSYVFTYPYNLSNIY